MIKQIDKNTRIKLKFHFAALNAAICLQRRRWYGWKTVGWIYPSVVMHHSWEYIKEYLEYKERKNKTQWEIGKEIMLRAGGESDTSQTAKI